MNSSWHEKKRVKDIIEKENNGTDFHLFESIPILT